LKVLLLIIFLELLIKSSRQIDEKISLSKQLFLKYTLPPSTRLVRHHYYTLKACGVRGFHKENTVIKAAYGKAGGCLASMGCSRDEGRNTCFNMINYCKSI
jgi:hypothetical protein